MIEAISGKGVNRAKAICDACGRDEVLACEYKRDSGGAWSPNEGQIINRVVAGRNWALVKGKLHCPACEAKRKANNATPKDEGQMTATTAKTDGLRKPTPKQKREIIGLLEEVYDDETKRYRGGETDKSVADAVGGGVLFGWVAEIREDLFGPDTRSQEVTELRAEMKRLSSERSRLEGEQKKLTEQMVQFGKNQDAIAARIERMV